MPATCCSTVHFGDTVLGRSPAGAASQAALAHPAACHQQLLLPAYLAAPKPAAQLRRAAEHVEREITCCPGAGFQTRSKVLFQAPALPAKAFVVTPTCWAGTGMASPVPCQYLPSRLSVASVLHTLVAHVIFGVNVRREEGRAKVVELQQLGSEAEERAREQAEAMQHLAYYLTKLEETQGKVGHRARWLRGREAFC